MAQEPERDLNGLPREKLAEVLESFRDPEVFNAVTGPWKSRVAWQGGMKARAYMRNHTVDMDEPGDLTATDVAASAHEQLLSAIGSCMTVGFVVNATKQGVRIHDLEVAVEGYFDNIRKWAGVEDEGNPAMAASPPSATCAPTPTRTHCAKSGAWLSRALRSPSQWSTRRRYPPTLKRSVNGYLRIRRLG